VATAGRDRDVLLWGNLGGECDNYALLRGHKNAVLELAWAADSGSVFSASADRTVAMWDAESGVRGRTFAGHTRIVNSVAASRRGAAQLLATGCDDGVARVYDARAKSAVHAFGGAGAGGASSSAGGGIPVIAVAMAEEGDAVYTGGVDGLIRQWDVRRGAVSLTLAGHGEPVTGLALSPDSGRLASFGMDHALRLWDVRPFCGAPSRCVRALAGASNSFEQLALKPAWSRDGERVAVGSAGDRMVYVWEADSGRLEYRLPGHTGA
jgi:Prp8 binding protein